MAELNLCRYSHPYLSREPRGPVTATDHFDLRIAEGWTKSTIPSRNRLIKSAGRAMVGESKMAMEDLIGDLDQP